MRLSAAWAYDWPKRNGWRDYGDEVGARGRAPEFGVEQFINNEEGVSSSMRFTEHGMAAPATVVRTAAGGDE